MESPTVNIWHMPTNYADVHAFHVKFGLPHPQLPENLDRELFEFRLKFMLEELEEYAEALGYRIKHDIEGMYLEETGKVDLPTAFDSLLDLVYVAMGTSVLHGFPWQAGWDEVQRANMSKVRVERVEDSKRGSTFDVIKPAGFEPPNIEGVLASYLELRAARTHSWIAHADQQGTPPEWVGNENSPLDTVTGEKQLVINRFYPELNIDPNDQSQVEKYQAFVRELISRHDVYIPHREITPDTADGNTNVTP